jgi:hypothetical protein
MLYLAYLGEAKKLSFNEMDLKLLIVRKPVSGIPEGFIHVPQLSPSLTLFDKAPRWKKGMFQEKEEAYLRSIGITENTLDAWWFLYEKEFKRELEERPDMVRAIERLGKRLEQGEEIYVFCYCKNLCRCHRRLVGEHMQEKGYEVNFRKPQINIKPTPVEQLSLFD